MNTHPLDKGCVEQFLRAALGADAGGFALVLRRLRGGLDSAGVWHIRANYTAPGRARRASNCVLKRLPAGQAREAKIYRHLLHRRHSGLSPKLLGTEERGGFHYLYLEPIRPAARWPWRESSFSGEVLKTLAKFHSAGPLPEATQRWFTQWDYEKELQTRGEDLVKVITQTKNHPALFALRKGLPALHRMISALPAMRRQLLSLHGFQATLIHGDVHPGNVRLRKTSKGPTPVFIDWARSRIGSPLEDVSSWLQSLGYWEPEARRRHDTLLMTYLQASGKSSQAMRGCRDAYWLAAASNLLAGAVLYHLSLAVAPARHNGRRQESGFRALADCLRVIRRADAYWTSSLWLGSSSAISSVTARQPPLQQPFSRKRNAVPTSVQPGVRDR